MKKYIACLLLALALTMTACGNQQVEQVETETAANETDNSTSEATEAEDSSEAVTEQPSLYSYDSEDFRFEILSVDPTAEKGYEMKLLFENKVKDFELHCSFGEFSVQRYLSSTFKDSILEEQQASALSGTISIDPLTTREFSVYLNWDSLSKLGITSIDEISFNLRVWNWDYIDGEDVAYETVTIYPSGLTKDTIVVPDMKQTENMKTVLENDHIRMICLDIHTNEEGELLAQYYVENKSDTYTTIELLGDGRSLNGQPYDTSWLYPVYLNAGQRCYVNIGFYHEEVSELADLTSPEQISSFEVNVLLSYYDAEMNWHEDEYRLVY